MTTKALCRTGLTIFCALALTAIGAAEVDAQSDVDLVQEVVTTAYVEGIHINRDPAAVRAGFHETFVMAVRSDDGVSHVSREDWIGRMRVGQRNSSEVTPRFVDIAVVGNTAMVRLELFIDGNHVFTDLIGLYRFEDGWKLVNKIFERH